MHLQKVAADHRHELNILSMLSSGELQENAQNHCVPLLDAVEDEDWGIPIIYTVIPRLRPVDEASFEIVDEVLDFVDQMLNVRLVSLWRRSS